jgi:hypothetical protein
MGNEAGYQKYKRLTPCLIPKLPGSGVGLATYRSPPYPMHFEPLFLQAGGLL